MGRGHPTSRPTSYVTGLEVLLEAKNAEIAELQAQVDADEIAFTEVAKSFDADRMQIEQLQAQVDQPIKIKANTDGQVWITFDAGEGRKAMLNLNNILLDQNCSRFWVRSSASHSMPKAGITHGICLDALAAAIKGDNNGKT